MVHVLELKCETIYNYHLIWYKIFKNPIFFILTDDNKDDIKRSDEKTKITFRDGIQMKVRKFLDDLFSPIKVIRLLFYIFL